MRPATAKPTLFDYAALAFSAWAVSQIAYWLWRTYHDDQRFFGYLLVLVLGPAVIAGTLLLITYRKDVRQNPAAALAGVLTGFAFLYLAALPLALGLHVPIAKAGFVVWKIYLYIGAALGLVDQRIFSINGRIFDAIYRVLHPLIPEKIPVIRNDQPVARIIRPPLAKDVHPPAPPPKPKPTHNRGN